MVDNHPVIRKFMSDLIGKKGYEVVTAEDGLSALKILETSSPEVIFLDLVMPNISGEKVCQTIRRKKNLNHCLIVVLSAIAVEEQISLEDLGADIILAKAPFDKLSRHVNYIMEQVELGLADRLKGSVLGRENLYGRQITKELLASRKHHDMTLKHMSDGLLELLEDARIVYANPAALSIIGMAEEDLLSADFIRLFEKTDQPGLRRQINRAVTTGQETLLDRELKLNSRMVSVKIIPVPREKRGCSLLAILRDVTRQRQAEQELAESRKKYEQERNFLENVFENSADAIAIVDQQGRFLRWNSRAAELFGFSFEELRGKKAFELYADKLEMEKMLDLLRREGSIQNYEIAFVGKDDTKIPCAVSISLLKDETNRNIGSLSIIRDLTQWKQTEEKLKYLSFHDALTGLYNRAFFEEEMKRLGQGRHLPLGIIVCDINGLKLVNDTLGHQQGDALLKAAAEILKHAFRSSDIIARIGGDEFAVLLPESSREAVTERLDRIQRAIEAYNEKQPRHPLSLSAGYAVRSEPPLDMQDLFRQADNNMYAEKFKHMESGASRVLQTLTEALETKDYIRDGHARRLRQYCRKLAEKFGLSEKRAENLQLLANFHDIGKISLPDSILFKDQSLSEEELLEMKKHCETGHRIAMSMPDLAPVADLILMHHEHWDGRGYPRGLGGEEIPLECRILAVADAYDAMTRPRPYRKEKTRREAVAELRQKAGTQFDPEVVEEFIRILEESGPDGTIPRRES